MMRWAVQRGYRTDNPCREIDPLPSGDGYEPWPWHVIESARDNLRTDLWWAVALAVYTGQRQADVLKMRWDAIKDGKIKLRQGKTRKTLTIPLHAEIQPIIDTIPRSALTILTNSRGTPWTESGFRATWRKHRPALVIEDGLVFHGQRKTAVVTLLEAGCTDAEVASITGQTREMIEHYAKQVNQERLADVAMLKWQNKNET